MVRVNGFDRPFHPLQVLTWLVFPCIVFGYYGIAAPMLQGWALYASFLAYTILAAVTFFSAWITSAIDPRDPRVGEARNSNSRTRDTAPQETCLSRSCEPLAMSPELSPEMQRQAEDETIVCYLCEARVESSSKHCRFCDKCIVRFDHHCKWLNTCIGRRNYAYFLLVIASTWLFSLLQLAITGYLLVRLATPSLRPAGLAKRADRHWLLGSTQAVVAALGAWCAVLVPLVGLVGQLGAFHVMLVSEGLTTYEYILNEQRKDQSASADSSSVGAAGSTLNHRRPRDLPNCLHRRHARPRPDDAASALATGGDEHTQRDPRNGPHSEAASQNKKSPPSSAAKYAPADARRRRRDDRRPSFEEDGHSLGDDLDIELHDRSHNDTVIHVLDDNKASCSQDDDVV